MLTSGSNPAAGAACLRRGGLVAFPTETVYGLGADATSPDAVARIFAAKRRPAFNPLIAHVATSEAARREGSFSPAAERLAAAFWPGPLTLVLPRAQGSSICDLACAGLSTVGLRVPAHDVALDLLQQVGRPVAAPSANPSGHLSPTTAEHVRADLGALVDLVLDGGPCAVGVESTIVACLGDVLTVLRPGGLSREAIEAVAGQALSAAEGRILAPGMLASHYAPRARLRLEARKVAHGEIGLDFAGTLGCDVDLSPSGDLTEAAANLYRLLRALDAERPAVIAIAWIPNEGIGAAINDRLRRAAAPR